MTGVGTVAALVLATVLLWAGLAKAMRPRGTAASFEGLGVPAARLWARVTPVAEAATGVALVWRPRVGAVVALALLAAFTVVLVRAVRAGAAVGCACFGASAARPVSSVEVVRNAGLAVLALVALVPVRPAAPALADVVLVTTASALGAVGLAALELRGALGRIWDNRLAGEVAR